MREPERRITPEEKEAKRCPVCGAEWPAYIVEDMNHVSLGCENCLTIRRDGVIQ